VKTDRRDAKKLVGLYRAQMLRFVHPPTAELEGLRDLLRCRDDVRCARMAARNRVLKQLLRHGRIFREGKTAWTKLHRGWLARQRLDDPLAHEALEQLLIHLDGIERQLATLDARLAEIADSERWAGQVQILTRFRGIATVTALGLIAEIGDFRPLRPSPRARVVAGDHPQRVLLGPPAASWAHHPVGQPPRPPTADRGRVALVPRSPASRQRPAARRAGLARPSPTASPTPPPHRARQAHDGRQRRGRSRTRRVSVGGDDRPAAARHRAVRRQPRPPAPGGHRLARSLPLWWGQAARCEPPGGSSFGSMRSRLATLVRGSSRPDTLPAVPTRASQSDSRRCPRTRRPAPPTPATMTNKNPQSQRPLDTRVHLRPYGR
jgi:hypothetical protein